MLYNIVILWGTDGFWKWLTSYILEYFSQHISQLIITGKNKEKWEKTSQKLKNDFLLDHNIQTEIFFSDHNTEAVKNADIVIYAVPISQTEQIIKETLPFIPSWAVVADVTSIKWFTSKAMQMRDDIIVIPTHPMFGPYIQTIAGQVVVLTPEARSKTSWPYEFLKYFLEKQKAKVIEVTPKEHDRMMAVVQGLTHLSMFVIGETMKRLNFHIWESMNFVSPIYKMMISSVGRYLGQNPKLYADIQMYNEEVLSIHEAFLETAKNFHKSVSFKDTQKFISDIEEARDYIGIKYCEEWQLYTDKLISMLSRQQEILKNNIWKEIRLHNIYTSETIIWVLEKYENRNIFFRSGQIFTIDEYEVSEIETIF